jgi:hypothetical protein
MSVRENTRRGARDSTKWSTSVDMKIAKNTGH